MPKLKQLWVSLRTGDINNAGTDADFSIEIVGPDGNSLDIAIPDIDGYNDYERASSSLARFDIYYVWLCRYTLDTRTIKWNG
jgi:hypothetical protein